MTFTFPAAVAWDPNGKQAVKNTSFQVYATADTGFVTPLNITDPFGVTLPGNILNSGSQGVFPQFNQAANSTVVITDPAHTYAWTVNAVMQDASVAAYINQAGSATQAAVQAEVTAGPTAAALNATYVPASAKGMASGVATLDGSGIIPQQQIPATFLPKWQPTTAYATGQQVISPNNDVVSSVAAHTSGGAFNPSNWSLSASYVQWAAAPSGGDDTALIQGLLDVAAAAGGGCVRLRGALYRHTGLTIANYVSLVGATEGATVLRQSASTTHAIKSKNYDALAAAANSQTIASGTQFGIRLENLRLECNSASQSSAIHGIALWAFRVTMRNIYVYDTKGDGIHWGGYPGTATGNLPDGQVESSIENVWIRNAGGKGLYYYGPNDARATNLFIATCGGVGLDTANMDFGYVHVYGCQQGVVINGNTRMEHLETESNINEGLVANTSGSQTNYIGRLTAYQNWTSATATSSNYSIVLNGALNIGDALVNTTGATGGGGIQITTGADHTTIGNAKVTGTTGGGGLTGIFVAAANVNITADVAQYSTGILSDFNHSQSRIIRARIASCPTGFYENGASSGNIYDITYNCGSSAYTPWSIASGSKSFYNLTSYGSIISTYTANPNGVNRNSPTLSSGEATMPRGEVQSNVALSSGTLRLSYFTAAKTETINNIKGFTASTAAAATPTLCRLGLYSVDSSGNLTLVASCTSDTTMFAATTTAYTKALSAAYVKVSGQRYAIGALVVTGATAPTTPASFFSGPGSEMTATGPAEAAALSGQSDLPSSITVGSLSSSSQKMYAVVTP